MAPFHGIGKATVVKVAKNGILFCFDEVNGEIKSVEAQSSDAKPDGRSLSKLSQLHFYIKIKS